MIAVALVAVIAALAVWAVVSARSHPPALDADGDGEAGIDPFDLAELEERLDGADGDERRSHDAVLLAHLQPLVRRRVPVRSIEAVPGLRSCRVRFADGTAVVVRGEVAGDAGVLAAVVRTAAVLPRHCSHDDAGTRLVLAWSGGRRHVTMRVAGLDQPD